MTRTMSCGGGRLSFRRAHRRASISQRSSLDYLIKTISSTTAAFEAVWQAAEIFHGYFCRVDPNHLHRRYQCTFRIWRVFRVITVTARFLFKIDTYERANPLRKNSRILDSRRSKMLDRNALKYTHFFAEKHALGESRTHMIAAAHETHYARMHPRMHEYTNARTCSVSTDTESTESIATSRPPRPPTEWASSTSLSLDDPSRADSDHRLTTTSHDCRESGESGLGGCFYCLARALPLAPSHPCCWCIILLRPEVILFFF